MIVCHSNCSCVLYPKIPKVSTRHTLWLLYSLVHCTFSNFNGDVINSIPIYIDKCI